MIKKALTLILILSLVSGIFVSVWHFIKLKNELEQKKTRADCGINFDRLAKLFLSSRSQKAKKISEIIKSNEKIFIPDSNKKFADQLIIYQETADLNDPTPVLLISDKPSVHKDGRRHILMSDGKVYFLTNEDFEVLLKKQ